MAAASSSTPSLLCPDSSSYSGKWEYDVFLCFRGADTRGGFTSHLMAALFREKVKAFIDDKLDKSESIDELISVLQRSALSIVIFSENFADSSWCLDEVATIAQRIQKFGHRVLPVFYKVDPSDVSEDSGSYAAAIEQKHGARPPKRRKKKRGASKSQVDRKRWMDALKVVANCAGYTSQAIKIDSELVEAIINGVHNILIDMSPRVKSDNLIGMDARVSEVEQLLAINMNDIRIIELWGMGGVGKTTLARACYQRLISLTKGMEYHFVRDINQRCEKENGMEGIVTKLYSTLLSESNISYDDLDVSYRRSRLSRSRVFLVFDDVGTLLQLEQLLLGDLLSSTNLFAPGSRIIFTTRNRMVLGNIGARIYHVDILDPDESIQLFRVHAFGKRLPPDDLMELSRLAVSYCKGCPLAIKVFGGTLLDKGRSYWLSFLGDMRQIPSPGIHDVLERSYNALGVDHKRLFLDVACFFHALPKSVAIKYYSSSHVLEDLIDMSLCICVMGDLAEEISVHDLLSEMAWGIVNEESKLENRTRLENQNDIQKILTRSSAFERGRATEGITLNLSEAKDIHLPANTFEGMTSLRYLHFAYPGKDSVICKVHLPYGGLDSLPDSLRWLEWHVFPSKSLPSTFAPENLVVLNLRGSSILERCWEVQPKLVNLVGLDLSYCINLVEIPNSLRSPNIEYLFLRGCASLVELPPHVQFLNKLIKLDLYDCKNLRSLPVKLNSKFLKCIYLSGCPKVTRCPELNSAELVYLDLAGTPVEALPCEIYNVKRGGLVRLCGKHIFSFPVISASLKTFRLCHTAIREMDCYDDHNYQQGSLPIFVELELIGNAYLKSLSRNIWKMVSQTFRLRNCQLIESLPEISQPVDRLTVLDIRMCSNLKNFPAGIDNLKSLQQLFFSGTDIKSLPSAVQKLQQLFSLDLSFNKGLEFIPRNIHKLAKLSRLYLRSCSRIQSLPKLPPNLQLLDVSGCESLQALPSNIGRLRWNSLRFEDCPQLDTNLAKEVVLNFPNHAASNLHPQGVLQYSGSELPEWFAYESTNDSCMVVQLPTNWTTERPIKGIIFGVVCSFNIRNVRMTCDCNIGTTTAASWSSPVMDLFESSSDKVYVWYEKNLLGETKKGTLEEVEPWYERYAGLIVSLRFSLHPDRPEDAEKLKSIKIKRLGVSVLY
ncbi:unnamed protein product [Linum trigynum]|uniref:ADP-ribosyl cyclase/cyclic ADP-ribose hydrolase n=1 Tax=Linum trigynum TaxID=586398 RepID=A0AAV2GGK5_9ROSI